MISKPLLIGGAVAVGALFLLAGTSKAEPPAPSLPPQLPPPPGPPIIPVVVQQTTLLPASDGTFHSTVTGSLLNAPGYAGTGMYEVLAPHGLNIRKEPSVGSTKLDGMIQGSYCQVLDAPTDAGWVPVSSGQVQGFACLTCIDNPGGPWLALVIEGGPGMSSGTSAASGAAAAALGL